jgi:hypothetical protein
MIFTASAFVDCLQNIIGSNGVGWAAEYVAATRASLALKYPAAYQRLQHRPRIIELVKTRIPKRFGFDPIRDIQVLCPMNRGGVGAHGRTCRIPATRCCSSIRRRKRSKSLPEWSCQRSPSGRDRRRAKADYSAIERPLTCRLIRASI